MSEKTKEELPSGDQSPIDSPKQPTTIRINIDYKGAFSLHLDYDTEKVVELLTEFCLLYSAVEKLAAQDKSVNFLSNLHWNQRCEDYQNAYCEIRVQDSDHPKPIELSNWLIEAIHIREESLPSVKELARRAEEGFVRPYLAEMLSNTIALAIQLAFLHANSEGDLDSYKAGVREQLVGFIDGILEKWLPGQGKGFQPKNSETRREDEKKLWRFARRSNELQDLADHLVGFYQKNRKEDWIAILESGHAKAFEDLLEELVYDKKLAIEVARLIPDRINDAGLKTHNPEAYSRSASKLAIARELAARELGMTNANGLPLSPDTLSKKYTQGGGYRGRMRPA